MTVSPAAAARDEGHRQGPPPGSRLRHSTPHWVCADGREILCNPHRYGWRSQEMEASTQHSSVTISVAERSGWSAETTAPYLPVGQPPYKCGPKCFRSPIAQMEQ